MREASRQLQENCVPPDLELIDEMQFFRQRQFDLHVELNGDNSEFNEHANLDMLEERYSLFVQNESANSVLLQAETLKHTRNEEVLESVFASIEQVRKELEQDGAKVICEAFQNGTHPISALVSLVTDAESLDDSLWSDHMERVQHAFGRQVEIAVARGYLTIEHNDQSRAAAESALMD